MQDRAKFTDSLSVQKMETPHLSYTRLNGESIKTLNHFGSKNYKQIPTAKKIGWKLAEKICNAVDIPLSSKFLGTEQFIVEKFKEPSYHIAGFSNDPVDELNKKGYNFRDIAKKLGKNFLYEINIHTAKRFLPINNFVNVGYDKVWDLIAKDDVTATSYYDNTNAVTIVGTGAGAEADTDTHATLTAPVEASMEATFPLTTTSKRIDFKGSYGSAAANQAWNEAAVGNSAATPILLNRIVAAKGTKVSGETWTAEIQITGA